MIDADEDDARPHAAGDHALARGRGGRSCITPASAGSTPSASAGRAVRHEVDPQDLRRQQRQDHGRPPRARQPDHVGQQHAEEHRHHFADVRREQVAQELPDVGEDRAALLDRGDDRGEVVVGQHHVGGLLGDVGAGDPHGHADVGGLQRRRVVDAVAGHRHHRAAALQRLHDPQLVLGVDPRVDRHLPDRPVAAPSSDICSSSAPVTARPSVAMPSSAAMTAAVIG